MKKKRKKSFDAVKFFRQIRKIRRKASKDIYGMSTEELRAYFNPNIVPGQLK